MKVKVNNEWVDVPAFVTSQGGGDWKLIAELNITEPVAYFEQDLGKVYNECLIIGTNKMEVITSGASGNGYYISLDRGNGTRLNLHNGVGFSRYTYIHYINQDSLYHYVMSCMQCLTTTTNLVISGGSIPSWATKKSLDKICLEAKSDGMGFTGYFKIYAK